MTGAAGPRGRPCVDVVVVNWNAGPHLRRAVESVLRSTSGVRIERVCVVDNGSTDASIDGLESLAPSVEVVSNETNVGFAAGCNQGARRGRAEFVLFLNPDAAVEPDAIERSARFMSSPAAADVAVCGGLVVDDGGHTDCSCSRLPTLSLVLGRVTRLSRLAPTLFPPVYLGETELDADRPVPEVIGAFFFTRRSAFERLGGFDERYFLYYEEVDFCRRAQDAGLRVYFLRDVRVRHTGRVSTDQVKSARLFHSLYSRSLYARAHWPRWQWAALLLMTYLLELPARLVSGLSPTRTATPREVADAYRRLTVAYLGAGGRARPTFAVREAPS